MISTVLVFTFQADERFTMSISKPSLMVTSLKVPSAVDVFVVTAGSYVVRVTRPIHGHEGNSTYSRTRGVLLSYID